MADAAKLGKLIVKIIEKKKGVKLVDISTYLATKVGEIEGLEEDDVKFANIRSIVTQLFADDRIDIIEYKLPGEGEKNRIFCIPKDSVVTYTESEDVFADLDAGSQQIQLPDPVVEVKTIFPPSMFTGFVIISDQGADFLEQADAAQADYMDRAGKGENPKLFGAVPIQLQVVAILDSLQAFPSMQVEEVTTVTMPETAPAPTVTLAADAPLIQAVAIDSQGE